MKSTLKKFIILSCRNSWIINNILGKEEFTQGLFNVNYVTQYLDDGKESYDFLISGLQIGKMNGVIRTAEISYSRIKFSG